MKGVQVSDLDAMPRPALVDLWLRINASPPPRKLSRQLMARMIAYDIQVARDRALTRKARLTLEAVSNGKRTSSRKPFEPGTRFIREWNGVTYVVEATDKGYHYAGKSWRSLSAVARAITGAHWSGPRFFGLSDGEG